MTVGLVTFRMYFRIMKQYVVDREPTQNAAREHEVHREGCPRLPLKNFFNLGIHQDGRTALFEAKRFYRKVDGCPHCLTPLSRQLA